jgi:hypothetical protein
MESLFCLDALEVDDLRCFERPCDAFAASLGTLLSLNVLVMVSRKTSAAAEACAAVLAVAVIARTVATSASVIFFISLTPWGILVSRTRSRGVCLASWRAGPGNDS